MVKLIRQNLKENKKKFRAVEMILRNKLDYSIPIDHVGSTAIPNICGKNYY